MKRVFLTAVIAIVFVTALLLPAWSQRADKLRRVGVLFSGLSSDPAATPVLQALVGGLREHGWEEGRNVELEVRYSGRTQRASPSWPRNSMRLRSMSS